jgi:prepilin-type N-terminal cleavage/methylation domain-containing protein
LCAISAHRTLNPNNYFKLDKDKTGFMLNNLRLRNQQGFTLIEMISVMIIMGVVASVAIQKFDMLSDTAAEQALRLGVRELNVRESLAWSNLKISAAGWVNDNETFARVDTDLGTDYSWNPGPTVDGRTLHFRTKPKALDRDHSTISSAGDWQ